MFWFSHLGWSKPHRCWIDLNWSVRLDDAMLGQGSSCFRSPGRRLEQAHSGKGDMWQFRFGIVMTCHAAVVSWHFSILLVSIYIYMYICYILFIMVYACLYIYILQDEVSIYAHSHMEKTRSFIDPAKHPLQVRRAVSGQLRPQALTALVIVAVPSNQIESWVDHEYRGFKDLSPLNRDQRRHHNVDIFSQKRRNDKRVSGCLFD